MSMHVFFTVFCVTRLNLPSLTSSSVFMIIDDDKMTGVDLQKAYIG
jgi:hypothetical protein